MVRHCLHRAKKPSLFIFHVSVSEVSLNRCHLCDPTTWSKNKPLWVTHECIKTHTQTLLGCDAPSESKHSPSFQMCGLQWCLCSLTVLHRSMEKFKMFFSVAFSLLSSSTVLKAFHMVSKKEPPRLMLRQLVVVVWSISRKQLTMQDQAYLEKQIYKHIHIYSADHWGKVWLIDLDLYKHYWAYLGLSVWLCFTDTQTKEEHLLYHMQHPAKASRMVLGHKKK